MKLTLEQEANELRKEYFRKWRKDNKDKTKLHNQNYWERKAEKQLVEKKLNQDNKLV